MQNLVNYAYTSQIEIRKDNVQVSDQILCFIGLWGLGPWGFNCWRDFGRRTITLDRLISPVNRFFAPSNFLPVLYIAYCIHIAVKCPGQRLDL